MIIIVQKEGKLKTEDVSYINPIGCDIDLNKVFRPIFYYYIETKSSCISKTHFEDVLKALNGKKVRITIEAEV